MGWGEVGWGGVGWVCTRHLVGQKILSKLEQTSQSDSIKLMVCSSASICNATTVQYFSEPAMDIRPVGSASGYFW